MGIDIEAAHALGAGLRRWRHQTDDVAFLVMQAETQSDIASNAGPLLDQIGTDGVTLAGLISEAVRELTSFRIGEFATYTGVGLSRLPPQLRLSLVGYDGRLSASQRAEAAAVLRRIDEAIADHRVPAADDHARLRELFASAISDPRVSAAALGLALRGYPLQQAVLMYNNDHVAAVYDHVAESMEAGVSPVASGLPTTLFPPVYRQWHETARLVRVELQQMRDTGITPSRVDIYLEANRAWLDEQAALRLDGFNGNTFSFNGDGSVSKFAAVSTTAAWGGRTTSSWLGDALVPVLARADGHETLQIGAIMRYDSVAALSFMNELGAEAVGRLPDLLMHRAAEHFDAALADYSMALAGVSADPDLRFDGEQLVNSAPDARLAPELLLQAPGYDPAFVVGAAAASLRTHGRGARLGWLTGAGRPSVDPRSAAAQGVVNNGQSAALVRHLSEEDELDNLIAPDRAFGLDHPQLVGDEHNPLVALFAQAGFDDQASLAVVEFLHGRGEYDLEPVGSIGGDRYRDLRLIGDPRILTGVSALLAISASDYLEAQVRSPYFSAYHSVLISGSGDHLFHATDDMIAQRTQHLLATAAPFLDLADLKIFTGRVRAVRQETQLRNAELVDRAADNFSNTLSLLGIATGFGESGISKTVSASLSVASLATGSDNTALAHSKRGYRELLQSGMSVRMAGMITLFGTGLVRTRSGKKVELQVAPLVDIASGPIVPAAQTAFGFRLVQEGGGAMPLGEHGETIFNFDDSVERYRNNATFADLTVNGEPLSHYLTAIEAIDTDIDTAQAKAAELFDDA